MTRIARGIVGGVISTALLAGPALAQGYPPGAQTIEVSDSLVNPCERITVSGENLVPGTTIEITFDGQVIGTAIVGDDGTYSTTVQIPCETAPGTFVLSAGGVSTQITVVAAAGGVGGGVTGADLSAGIAIMVGLLVLGVGALVASRRRSRARNVQTPA